MWVGRNEWQTFAEGRQRGAARADEVAVVVVVKAVIKEVISMQANAMKDGVSFSTRRSSTTG
jgi:hypothetical protein